MKELLELVANYGLPMVLTIWFVLRLNPTITKLVNSLEKFIAWLTDKEEQRKEKDKEMKEALKIVVEQNAEVLNRIRILEVKLEK